jgi:hypothetical protein
MNFSIIRECIISQMCLGFIWLRKNIHIFKKIKYS